MKSLICTGSNELDRGQSSLMHCGEFDPRQVHDHQHTHSCFVSKSEQPTNLENQQRVFACGTGPHMLPLATRSFACSQLTGHVDYSSETTKQHHHHCKSEKHHDEDGGSHLSGKCQAHSNNDSSTGVLVKTEFNEMQQSKSSPVHEVFEMTSSAFTSAGTGGCNSSGQFHHDSDSPPPSSSAHHHLTNHQHHNAAQHQCTAHSYESYAYGSGTSSGRVGISPRQPQGTMNTTSSGSEISGGLYHCKSFFADSGSGNSGIAAFYPNNQQSNGESCRDNSSRFPHRESLGAADNDEKAVIAIKTRKMSD